MRNIRDLERMLEDQIKLLSDINEGLKDSDPEQAGRNADKISGLARTISKL